MLREREICYFTYLGFHWLIVACALTRDRTSNLGVAGRCSNQLNYLARALSLPGFIQFLSAHVGLIFFNSCKATPITFWPSFSAWLPHLQFSTLQIQAVSTWHTPIVAFSAQQDWCDLFTWPSRKWIQGAHGNHLVFPFSWTTVLYVLLYVLLTNYKTTFKCL